MNANRFETAQNRTVSSKNKSMYFFHVALRLKRKIHFTKYIQLETFK